MFESLGLSGWGVGWGASTSEAGPVCTEADVFWYERLTPEQQAALPVMRSTLEASSSLVPGIDDDHSLLRFLKAREFDVARAAAMYQDMAKWRADERVDTILERESFPELGALLDSYPMFYHKQDKFGRPVYIELLGRADSTKLLETVSIERLIQYHIYAWERYHRIYLPACSEASGKRIITTCVIVDLAGLSLANFNTSTQRIMNAYSKIDQDYYPEHLGHLFVINTPLIFRGIWAAVQPLLQERTRRKITILGADFLPTLKQVIDEDNIPTLFGGKSPTPDLKTTVGPWVSDEELRLAQLTSGDAVVRVSGGPAAVEKAGVEAADSSPDAGVEAQ